MIEIKNAKKIFNKHKKNKVTAICDTSITLDNTGLVALLGPSGCGKTTLLNSIGGLDKLTSGNIYVDGMKISSKLSYKRDKIRNLNIGYIFQDYKLIEDKSVFDNVAIVLKMIGIKDKEEIEKRVLYVLDKVGMLRYKKRPASMLSGGERQRVGIARAIVKDPNIILADEPTGNLDSKNSLEIMKIIRSISKERLVILVTHEVDLAKFYATRIIEIKDGSVIKDYNNEPDEELDYRIDNTFYLKDFDNKDSAKVGNNSINIYSNDKDKISLDIVVSYGNIYIRSNLSNKIEVVDENSSIELVDDHYKKIGKDDIDKYNFDFSSIINKDIKKKYSSIFNPITLLINGFKKVFNYSFLKKLLLFGFFLSGMFIMYAVSSIMATLKIDEYDFVKANKEYLTLEDKDIKVDDYLSYEQIDGINYILPGSSIANFSVNYKDYYQTSMGRDTLSGSLTDINMISNKDIIYGKMPESLYEIVVDVFAINKMFDSDSIAKMVGIKAPEDMLGRIININNMPDFVIVGITDLKSPSIYIDKSLFINILANSNENNGTYMDYNASENSIVDYSLYQDKIEIKKGREPINDYEVIVNINNEYDMKLNKEIDYKVNGKKLVVVGYYDSKYNYNYFFVNNNTIKYNLIRSSNNITIMPSDKDKVIDAFKEKKKRVLVVYDKLLEMYKDSKKENTRSSLIAASIILGISLIEIFLMIRSSFLSRVKEVGIYRAIGVKKIDIYKMFFGEIFAITTIASIPGIMFMAYILNVLSGIKYLSDLFIINIFGILITVIFVYIFNLIVGLFPVFNTIRKTPSQILSRYDLD